MVIFESTSNHCLSSKEWILFKLGRGCFGRCRDAPIAVFKLGFYLKDLLIQMFLTACFNLPGVKDLDLFQWHNLFLLCVHFWCYCLHFVCIKGLMQENLTVIFSGHWFPSTDRSVHLWFGLWKWSLSEAKWVDCESV